MRRLWIGLGVVLGLIVLLVVAGYVVLRSIDWNEYKEPIARIVYESTGRRLDLTGDISIAIGLRPGIALSGASFENASWSTEREMASLDELVLQLHVLPLLGGNVDIASLELRGLEVLLETNADGATNWTFEPPPSDEAPPQEDEEEDSGIEIDIQSLTLRDARIRIVDRASGSERSIDIDHLLATPTLGLGHVDVELVGRADGQPVRLEGESSGLLMVMEGAPHDVDYRLTIGDAEATLKGRIDRSVSPTTFDLTLAIQGERLQDWRPLVGDGVPALGAHRLSSRVSGSTERIAIQDLKLTIGESTLSGKLDVTLSGERTRVDAELTAPRIDMADLQEPSGPDTPVEEKGDPASGERLLSDAPLPFDALSTVDAKLDLKIGRLRADDMDLDDVELALDLEKGRLRVDPLALRLAEGIVRTTIEVDASRKPARVALKGSADRLVSAQLLRESDLIDGGPMELSYDVRGRGASVAAIASTLEGKIALELKGVRIKSATAGMAFADLQSAMLGRSDVRALVIDCAVADFDFQKGIGQPTALVFNLDSVALFGRGAIDLGEETFALRFDREAKGVSASRALPPFTVGGTFADPKTGVDALRLTGRVFDLGAQVLSGDIILDWEKWPKDCRELSAAYDRKRTEPSEASKIVRKGGQEALKALESLMRRDGGAGSSRSSGAARPSAETQQAPATDEQAPADTQTAPSDTQTAPSDTQTAPSDTPPSADAQPSQE